MCAFYRQNISFDLNPVSDIQVGNKQAYEAFFFEWQAKVYTYFLSKTRDEDFAEELTQLTFIKLWDYRSTLSAAFSLETQLFRIARTTMIDAMRERLRQQKLKQTLHEQAGESWHCLSKTNSDATGGDIQLALNELPPVRKKVFLLNRFYGYTCKQIASQLSISDRTVEKHISLAVKQLKKSLLLVMWLLLNNF